jgi:hypothetical protein
MSMESWLSHFSPIRTGTGSAASRAASGRPRRVSQTPRGRRKPRASNRKRAQGAGDVPEKMKRAPGVFPGTSPSPVPRARTSHAVDDGDSAPEAVESPGNRTPPIPSGGESSQRAPCSGRCSKALGWSDPASRRYRRRRGRRRAWRPSSRPPSYAAVRRRALRALRIRIFGAPGCPCPNELDSRFRAVVA